MHRELSATHKILSVPNLIHTFFIFFALSLFLFSGNSYSQQISPQDLSDYRSQLNDSVDKVAAIQLSFYPLIDAEEVSSPFHISANYLVQNLSLLNARLDMLRLLADIYNPYQSGDIAMGSSYGYYIFEVIEMLEKKFLNINSKYQDEILQKAILNVLTITNNAKQIAKIFRDNQGSK